MDVFKRKNAGDTENHYVKAVSLTCLQDAKIRTCVQPPYTCFE